MTGNIIERDGWIASEWFNSNGPVSLPKLRGKVVVLHAFQMLCPGCVSHGTPRASPVAQTFDADKVASSDFTPYSSITMRWGQSH